jgi:hypothetical protein
VLYRTRASWKSVQQRGLRRTFDKAVRRKPLAFAADAVGLWELHVGREGAVAVTTLAMSANLWLLRPVRSSIGLGVMLLGILFFRRFQARAADSSLVEAISSKSHFLLSKGLLTSIEWKARSRSTLCIMSVSRATRKLSYVQPRVMSWLLGDVAGAGIDKWPGFTQILFWIVAQNWIDADSSFSIGFGECIGDLAQCSVVLRTDVL